MTGADLELRRVGGVLSQPLLSVTRVGIDIDLREALRALVGRVCADTLEREQRKHLGHVTRVDDEPR